MKRLSCLLLVLLLAFVACNPEPVQEPIKDPELTLTSSVIMEFTADGGVGTIEYTLMNEKAGATFIAECEAEWISNFVFGNVVTFEVAANDGKAREATVTIKYDVVSMSVTVKQAAKDEDPKHTPEMDVEMASAMRIPSTELDLESNYFVVAFADDTENIELGVVLMGNESDTLLAAGEYSSTEDTLLVEACELYVNDADEEYAFVEGMVTVACEDMFYTFDIELYDADNRIYHFFYEGEVLNMEQDPNSAEEFTPVNVNADFYMTGNWFLQLYLDGKRYHEIEFYDRINPNDDYISSGVYRVSDGSIGEWSVYSDGPSTTCQINDAEIVLSNNANGTTTLEGFIKTVEGHHVTIDWTGVISGFKLDDNNSGQHESGDNIDFVASFFSGSYHAPSALGSAHNYTFVLSDVEITDADILPNATCFYFDLYSNECDITSCTIPNGVYYYDLNDTCAIGTASAYYTYGIKTNASGECIENYAYREGTITVTNGKIQAEFIAENGAAIKVSYEGDLSLGEVNTGLSTLTGDVELNIADAVIYAQYYGDYYASDADNWLIEVYADKLLATGSYFMLDLNADFYADNWGLDYVTYTGGSYINKFMPGCIVNGNNSGCWYNELGSDISAPLVDGNINIVFNADSTITINLNCVDDKGYVVKAHITGTQGKNR